MAVISNADTILDGDKLMDVKVVLHVTVNRSAYRRNEYSRATVADIREDIRCVIVDVLELHLRDHVADGVISDIEMVDPRLRLAQV